MNITDGKCSDNKAADDIPVNPYSIVAADRGYCDYSLLSHWDSNNVFFVIRQGGTTSGIRPFGSVHPPEKRAQNVLVDEDIELELPAAKKKYPKKLRRIAVWNEEHCFVVELLTNNFTLAASTLAAIYKARWNIEIFFRNLGAASAHKELQRYHTQRCGNPDMDGTDNYAHPDMAETHRQVQVGNG